MNPMALKITALSIQKRQPKIKASPIESKNDKGFASLIKGLTKAVQNGSSHRQGGPAQAGQVKKKYALYLEHLRKGLLVKGMAIDETTIGRKDFPVLKEFLIQCGFAPNKAEQFLETLAEQSPNAEINLSQFFAQISELAPPSEGPCEPISLDPSAIPHIESALRQFGLTPREVQNALNAARGKEGDLDLTKLVAELKEIAIQVKGREATPVDDKAMAEISKKLQEIGIQMPHREAGKPITLEDLTAALDKMTARKDEADHLPTPVKASIEKIVDRVVAANNKDKSGSAALSVSKRGPTPLFSREGIGRNGESLEKQGPASSRKELDPVQSKVGLRSQIEAVQGLKEEREELRHGFESKLRRADIAQDITRAAFSESAEAVKQNQRPARHPLPTYLIDQVGKQVARSVLRGEKTLRLQLKPPELGTLKVEMAVKDSTLKLGVLTESNSVKELLLSNVHELRETLMQQGIKLERVDIQINYDFDHALASSKEGLKEGQRRHQSSNGVPFTAEPEKEVALPLRQSASSDRLLDLMA